MHRENKSSSSSGNKRPREKEAPPFHRPAPSGPPSSTKTSPSPLSHPFPANFNDHFETSTEAVQDVLGVVLELRQLLRPSTGDLFTLYDPYYCTGAVKQTWSALGIPRVINEDVDFYASIAQDKVPPHDVLVTNPPFSGDHIERLLKFLLEKNSYRPWAMLAPDYIASKPWYTTWIQQHYRKATRVAKGVLNGPRSVPPPSFDLPPFLRQGTDGPPPETLPVEPFYIVPRQTYDFKHPLEGVGKEHSHFKSMWYVWAGRHTPEVIRAAQVHLLQLHSTNTAPAVLHGLEALKESRTVAAVERRPNPRQRTKQSHASQKNSRNERKQK